MPFNYQSLKNITGAAIVDGSLTENTIANLNVSADKLELSAITAAKLATGSVNLASATVAGTLPVNKGGTNLTTFAGGNRAIFSDGTNLSQQPHGVQSMQVFTGNTTWSRPAGVRFIKVQVQGAAGGGSGHGEGGAAGGYAERFLDVTNTPSVTITIGGGGGGTFYANAGGNSGGTSFGPFVSASGGHGANRQNQHSGGVSGTGSGGNLNVHTGGGYSHHARDSQAVAEGFFGGGAPSSYPNGGSFGHNHESHTALGSGGAGSHFHSFRGSSGRPGVIIVTNYF